MKNKRQDKIMELINESEIDTQEMLQSLLAKSGFRVTQATVSRDIKEMKLVKRLGANGGYKYVPPADEATKQNIFIDTVTSVDYAMNMVVVKCRTGMAQAACAALDSMNNDFNILGTIAGDDTIFILMRTESEAGNIAAAFRKMVWG